MNTKQLALLSFTFLTLVGGFIVLSLNGVSTESYSVFLVGAIIPTIAGAYAAKNAGQARDLAQTAVTQTNGNLTALMQYNKRLVDIIESHGISTSNAEDKAATKGETSHE